MNRADVTDTVAFTGQPVTRAGGTGRDRLRVLLVEDDPADAFLVRELLDDVHAPVELDIATSMADARTRLAGIDCVLLDLGLPDASGLTALRQVLSAADGAAVCVLTGLADEHIGVAAVAEGAQDYLVKGRVDGEALKRSLRYAVERRRADEGARRLREAELRQAESARLERGLLPQPLISSGAAALESFYRPGRHRALLGGDGGVRPCQIEPGLVLGIQPGVPCPATRVRLDASDWGLLLYTDGLIEGHAGDGRLGVDGLCTLLDGYDRTGAPPHALPDWIVGRAEERNGEPLADDVAMLLVIAGGAAW